MLVDGPQISGQQVNPGARLPIELQFGRVAYQQKHLMRRFLDERFRQVMPDTTARARDKNTFWFQPRDATNIRFD